MVRGADLGLCETGASWPASPAQLPVSTAPHPTRTEDESGGQSDACSGVSYGLASPVLSSVTQICQPCGQHVMDPAPATQTDLVFTDL